MEAVFTVNETTSKLTKFKVGAPLPIGRFFITEDLTLIGPDNTSVSSYITAVQLWPDNSIKWVNIEGIFNKNVEAKTTFFLKHFNCTDISKRHDWVQESTKELIINTSVCSINVQKNDMFILSIDGQLCSSFTCELNKVVPTITNISTQYQVIFDTYQKPLLCRISQTGIASSQMHAEHQVHVNIECQYDVYFVDGEITVSMSIHNPKAIVHNNGKWDLGNANSIRITALRANFDYSARAASFSTEPQDSAVGFEHFSLIQYSSGGENWDSENHKNQDNIVPLKRKGSVAEIENLGVKKTLNINRPQPSVVAKLSKHDFILTPIYFWEQFPVSIKSSWQRTCLDFAEILSDCDVELQAGEIKTHQFKFGISTQKDMQRWAGEPAISLTKSGLIESKCLPFVNIKIEEYPLKDILDFNGLQTQGWVAKREQVDEYGWRNFGDLYADHEAADYQGKGVFVSHYNNQYDPLLGFLKQWMLLGNFQYKRFADELFQHIVNIDIYHTNEDKPEYNKGLFWHTDHYVPAETASHRTYSNRQASGVYIDHAGGGGPGAHHCYSSGLAYYYLLTGNLKAQKAVVGLAQWMTHIYEGDGTILGLVLRAKNANHLHFPFTKKLVLGFGTGVVRNIFTNKYPLDRGTGNYVNCLLDAYEITSQYSYLLQAEFVLLNTISENDDITQRNFEDIENTWFYTVLLQSALKYLEIKYQLKSETPASATIRKAFIHYTEYMAENESHYLANASVLEYPNDTWTGQDLRKIHLLQSAYVLTQNTKMLDKAESLASYVYPKLINSPESFYTRIQALIMQNMNDLDNTKHYLKGYSNWLASSEKLSPLPPNRRLLRRMLNFLYQYSIKNELRLICVRIPFFAKVFKG